RGPARRDHNNPAGPSPSGADAQAPNDPRADLVTLAAVITAFGLFQLGGSVAGFGLDAEGQGCGSRGGACAPPPEGPSGVTRTPARHTGPGSPTAEDGSSGANRLSRGAVPRRRFASGWADRM